MNEATRHFIRTHRTEDVRSLALQASRSEEVDITFALNQIQGWQTAQAKLPSWAALEEIIYPPHLNMEQCSSEATARYKAALVMPHAATETAQPLTLVDLTGGFGVDFSWMARRCERAWYVERNADLCQVAEQNFHTLGLRHVEAIHADALSCLEQAEADAPFPSHVSVIYMDPARRDSHGGKVVDIADCQPDVLSLLPKLLKRCDRLILKLSPMLDWHKAVAQLQHVHEVHIVSVGNECKELLLILSPETVAAPCVVCANLEASHTPSAEDEDDFSEYSLTFSPDEMALPSTPQAARLTAGQYLYEPNASIMKAGCFAAIAQRYHVEALSKNTHLYVSGQMCPSFPGRRFVIEAVSSFNKKALKQHLQGISKANIATRNFPLTVAELRKRLRIKEGGDYYLFATTFKDHEHVVIITKKV